MELSFQTGDIIEVFGDMDDDGFFMGELNGVRGLVPSNFLTEAPHEYGDGRGGRRGGGPPVGPPDHRRPPGPGMTKLRFVRKKIRLLIQHLQFLFSGARGPPPPPREGAPMMGPSQGRGGPRKGRLNYAMESQCG